MDPFLAKTLVSFTLVILITAFSVLAFAETFKAIMSDVRAARRQGGARALRTPPRV